jgi:hypothetical protein
MDEDPPSVAARRGEQALTYGVAGAEGDWLSMIG